MHSETGNTFGSAGEQPNFGFVSPVVSTKTESSNPHTPENHQSIDHGAYHAYDAPLHCYRLQPDNNVFNDQIPGHTSYHSIDHGTYPIQDSPLHGYGSQPGNNVSEDQIPGRTDCQSVDHDAHEAQYMPVYGHESQFGIELSEDQSPAYTLQSAYPSHGITPHRGLTQQMERTQHTHLDAQQQVTVDDIPVTQLLDDPSFREYLDRPEASVQMPMSQKSALNSVFTQHAYPNIQPQASDYDVTRGQLNHDPSFRQNVQPR